MEDLAMGTITFNERMFESNHVLDEVRQLQLSEQAGWTAYFKLDYELNAFKDFIGSKAPELLKQWEVRRGKKVHGQNKRGNRKVGEKILGRK